MRSIKSFKRNLAVLLAVCMGVCAAFSYAPAVFAGEGVYVLVQTSSTDGTNNYKYSYNGKGLLTKEAGFGLTNEEVSFTYDKKSHLTDIVWKYGAEQANYHFNYSKKGERTQMTSNLFGSTTVNFVYDKKHRLSQEVWSVNSIAMWKTATYNYGEKNRIVSYAEKHSDGYDDSVQILSYDKRGNLSKIEYGNRQIKYKNTYKSGHLVKRDEGGNVTTFKYKKIYVDGKLASRIKAQQFRLVNDKIPGYIY